MSARAWAAASLAMAALDLLWLGVLARDLYQKAVGHLMAGSVRWGAAAAFYVLYGAGIAWFAVRPASSPRQAAWQGALLGGLVYGVYELTNRALLRDWPGWICAADAFWGAAATAAAAALATWAR